MRERDLFKGTAGNADEDAAFIKRMENSYKRLRVNMAAAYRRERAELRQNHRFFFGFFKKKNIFWRLYLVLFVENLLVAITTNSPLFV